MARTYSSPVRDEQTTQTRRRIVGAAYELFVADGYTATTVTAIASRAGVSAQTIYNLFGSKPALLKTVYDHQLVGDDAAIPLADRPEVRAAYAETDPRRFLAAYAAIGRQLWGRLGPLVRVIAAGASAGDPELQAQLDVMNDERLSGTTMVAERLAELHALRPGVSVERARDAIWALNGIEMWDLLTRRRGWTDDELTDWLADTFAAAVLDPSQRPATGTAASTRPARRASRAHR